MNQVMRIAGASMGIGLAVFALKAAAWWLTGSAALYSDALETVVNIAASGLAWWALGVAARPADSNHPYGHDKAEFLAAVVEGVLIVVAAVSILQHAWNTYRHPHALTSPSAGVLLSLAATSINLAWAMYLFRVAKRARSPALRADGRHLMADVATGCGVVTGVVLVVLTGRLWLDPAVAALTAAYVLWSGMHLIGESVGGLMDMAPADGTIERIMQVLKAQGQGAIEAHELRTRQAGRLTFLQFHLVVPGDMRVAEAHDICDRIESALKAEMSHLIVNIHVEPEHKAKHVNAVTF